MAFIDYSAGDFYPGLGWRCGVPRRPNLEGRIFKTLPASCKKLMMSMEFDRIQIGWTPGNWTTMENPNIPFQEAKRSPEVRSAHPAMGPDGTETKKNGRGGFEERVLHEILDQTQEALIVCDASGIIIRVSHAVNRYGQQQYLNRPFDEIFHLSYSNGRNPLSDSPSPNLSKKFMTQVLHGETVQGENVYLENQEGTFAKILFSARPIHESKAGRFLEEL